MAGDEHQAQNVVALAEGPVQIAHRRLLPPRYLAAHLLLLALEHPLPAQQIDRTALGGGHEPRPRIVRDARLGPPLERHRKGVLRQLFSEPNVPHHSREPRDDPRPFDSPDRVDRAACSRLGRVVRAIRGLRGAPGRGLLHAVRRLLRTASLPSLSPPAHLVCAPWPPGGGPSKSDAP